MAIVLKFVLSTTLAQLTLTSSWVNLRVWKSQIRNTSLTGFNKNEFQALDFGFLELTVWSYYRSFHSKMSHSPQKCIFLETVRKNALPTIIDSSVFSNWCTSHTYICLLLLAYEWFWTCVNWHIHSFFSLWFLKVFKNFQVFIILSCLKTYCYMFDL